MEKALNDLIKISKKYKKQKDLEHLEVEYLSVFYEGKDFGNYLYKHLSPYFVSNGSSMGEKNKVYCFVLESVDDYEKYFVHAKKIKHYSPSENQVFQKAKYIISTDEDFVYDSQNHCIIYTNRDETIIFSNRLHYNQACKRVIRDELIYGLIQSQATPSIMLHSSCAVDNTGKAILICGDKGAGKTTTLVNLLDLGYDLLSNDLTFVKQVDGKIWVKGTPESINIGLGTASKFEQLQDIIPENMRELSDHDLWSTHLKPELNWQSFANKFNVKLISEWTELSTILFPKIGEGLVPECNKIEKIQLKKNLQNSFRGINVGHNIPWSTLIEKRHKEVQSSEISKLLDGLLNKSAYKIRYSGKKDELSSLIYESITKKLS